MNLYKRIFAYTPEAKKYGILSFIFAILSVISVGIGYFFIYQVLHLILMEQAYPEAKQSAIISVIALTLGSLCYLSSGLFSHVLAFRLETILKKKGIQGLSQAGFRFFDINPSGVIRKTIDDNTALTHTAVAHMIPDSIISALTPIAALIIGFIVNWQTGLTLCILALLCALVMKAMMGGQTFMTLYQNALKEMSAETVEYVRGIPVIKIFGADIGAFKKLERSIDYYAKNAYAYTNSCKWPFVTYQWLFSSLIALLILALSFFMDRLSLDSTLIISLTMILFLSSIIMVSFMKVMYASQHLFNARYAIDQLEHLYNEIQKDHLTHGQRTSFDHYQIDIKDVHFSYQENKVFSGLNLHFDEGKTYALVGNSGSGKSTLAKLLSGFYSLDQGSICIGGYSIREYTEEALSQAIAFVFQSPQLFKRSIYENVALAKKDATKEDVMRALSLAGCDSILDQWTTREHTVIGSQGVHLSGGEKQRIAIARAILKDAPIIIMDEASAAIDADNEYELQRSFKNLMQGKTVIMIAHRLSSIRHVDEILVLDQGQIIERGSHEALLNQHGVYERLLTLYQSSNEWRINDAKAI